MEEEEEKKEDATSGPARHSLTLSVAGILRPVDCRACWGEAETARGVTSF